MLAVHRQHFKGIVLHLPQLGDLSDSLSAWEVPQQRPLPYNLDPTCPHV